MAKAIDVAYYLVKLRNLDAKDDTYVSLNNLKLQKLLYYCHGAHIKWDDAALITDELFEAWAYGPTIRSVYFKFARFGQNDIRPSIPKINLSPAEMLTIEAVWSQLKSLSALTLVERTIRESPWKTARANGSHFLCEPDIHAQFKNE